MLCDVTCYVISHIMCYVTCHVLCHMSCVMSHVMTQVLQCKLTCYPYTSNWSYLFSPLQVRQDMFNICPRIYLMLYMIYLGLGMIYHMLSRLYCPDYPGYIHYGNQEIFPFCQPGNVPQCRQEILVPGKKLTLLPKISTAIGPITS